MTGLEKLYDFMKQYKVDRMTQNGQTITYTHSMLHEPYGAYDIPDNAHSEFINLYVDAIVTGHIPHIMEKHKECGPIVIDLDFKYSKGYDSRYYTTDTINEIIKIYNSVISDVLNVSETFMDAYVLEKKNPDCKRSCYRDGLHIIYPYICTGPSTQILMRDKFNSLAIERKIFAELPLENDIDTIFDKHSICNTGQMMYGSRKNPLCSTYYVTHHYKIENGEMSHTVNDIDIADKKNTMVYVNLLSCRRFNLSLNDGLYFAKK